MTMIKRWGAVEVQRTPTEFIVTLETCVIPTRIRLPYLPNGMKIAFTYAGWRGKTYVEPVVEEYRHDVWIKVRKLTPNELSELAQILDPT